jgi:hypothetical protein
MEFVNTDFVGAARGSSGAASAEGSRRTLLSIDVPDVVGAARVVAHPFVHARVVRAGFRGHVFARVTRAVVPGRPIRAARRPAVGNSLERQTTVDTCEVATAAARLITGLSGARRPFATSFERAGSAATRHAAARATGAAVGTSAAPTRPAARTRAAVGERRFRYRAAARQREHGTACHPRDSPFPSSHFGEVILARNPHAPQSRDVGRRWDPRPRRSRGQEGPGRAQRSEHGRS